MEIKVHYQGLDHSLWVEQFMTRKVAKLERFLAPTALTTVHLCLENNIYTTTLSIHSMGRDFYFKADGENLYESFTGAIDKASRALVERKRQVRNRIFRRAYPRDKVA
jgi:ribosome-associated translation inhibitor RaiA